MSEIIEVYGTKIRLPEQPIQEEEELEITPIIKKRKTKKEKMLKVNPPGKKGTRRKKLVDFEIIEE